MLFGVHNHYNNNSASIGDYRDAQFGIPLVSEALVRMTNQGIVIFNLHKSFYELDRKLAVADELDKRLKHEFGTGLSFATCGASDCLIENELEPFFTGIKAINPAIKTLYATYKHGDDHWRRFPERLKVDHIVEARRSVSPEIIKIVSPTEADKVQPPEGWAAFRDKLKAILEDALAVTELTRKNPEPPGVTLGRQP